MGQEGNGGDLPPILRLLSAGRCDDIFLFFPSSSSLVFFFSVGIMGPNPSEEKKCYRRFLAE